MIPAALRKKLRILPGTKLTVTTNGRSLILQPEDDVFSRWLRDRPGRGLLKVDRSASMPPAPELYREFERVDRLQLIRVR